MSGASTDAGHLEDIGALAPQLHAYPDQLAGITVLQIGVEIGGIAGFHHLFVRVRRAPDWLACKRS